MITVRPVHVVIKDDNDHPVYLYGKEYTYIGGGELNLSTSFQGYVVSRTSKYYFQDEPITIPASESHLYKILEDLTKFTKETTEKETVH